MYKQMPCGAITDPIEMIDYLIATKHPLVKTFEDEYKAYIEVLNNQVFNRYGYKLTLTKL